MYKRHITTRKCKHCHELLGYDLMTIGCYTKAVLFLTCVSCKTQNVFVWSDGSEPNDPDQLNLFQGSTKL